MNPIAKLAQVVACQYSYIFRKHMEVDSKVQQQGESMHSCFIPKKYGNSYQNPTASIKSYWELCSQVPPQFPSLTYAL